MGGGHKDRWRFEMERGRLISKVITLDEDCLFSKFTLKIT